ncbi:hypothetical protein [Fructilactobacillus frigidiflavus]|uniref:hypothetical protein n=1 Tax=Fructilactobacillus frigidiflavus TaxID=3242688 RepID=UPI00375630F6
MLVDADLVLSDDEVDLLATVLILVDLLVEALRDGCRIDVEVDCELVLEALVLLAADPFCETDPI